MNEYLAMWQNGFNFKDRTSCRGYWMAMLFHIVISIMLKIFAEITDITIFIALSGIYQLVALIPSISIEIRRFRDVGKSPFNVLWFLVPFIGWAIGIVMLCGKTTSSEGEQI